MNPVRKFVLTVYYSTPPGSRIPESYSWSFGSMATALYMLNELRKSRAASGMEPPIVSLVARPRTM